MESSSWPSDGRRRYNKFGEETSPWLREGEQQLDFAKAMFNAVEIRCQYDPRGKFSW